MVDRKSIAEIPVLIDEPIELAEKEASNALEQFDYAMEEVERWVSSGKPNLRVSILLTLHRHALEGIDTFAGAFRPASVAIKGSEHEPIASTDVARYVEDMFDYISSNWDKSTAIHLSSYVMWRLNWIHPFADGNGRTSRMLSYMILCGKLGHVLPGSNTIPEQISENKAPYYEALEIADKNYKDGKVDVLKMEGLMEKYLANQLVLIQEQAIGHELASSSNTSKDKNNLIKTIESHPVIFTAIVAIIIAIITGLMAN